MLFLCSLLYKILDPETKLNYVIEQTIKKTPFVPKHKVLCMTKKQPHRHKGPCPKIPLALSLQVSLTPRPVGEDNAVGAEMSEKESGG